MPVYYNTEAQCFAITSEYCTDCGEPLYDTGCDAPGCLGYSCDDCGTGCDIEFEPDGTCAQAIAAESDEDHDARVDAERAAFGLQPLAGRHTALGDARWARDMYDVVNGAGREAGGQGMSNAGGAG